MNQSHIDLLEALVALPAHLRDEQVDADIRQFISMIIQNAIATLH